MKPCTLFDAEWKIMQLVWEQEPVTAKSVALLAEAQIGWNKNTTYTVLTKLVRKKVLKRTEPDFTLTALLRPEDARRAETHSLIERLYGGSRRAFFAAFAEEDLSQEEVDELRRLIDRKG